MKDHIVVVEAPLFEERSVAVMNAIEAKIPGKPIKYLVMTHFHIDHSEEFEPMLPKALLFWHRKKIWHS